MASKHLTLRMDSDALARLEEASDRTGQTRSELARTLIEEGLRMAKHPGIVFRDGATGRRAALANGPQVWTLITTYRGTEGSDNERVDQTAEWHSITPWQVRAGLSYYAEFAAEVDDRIRRNSLELERGYADWMRQQGLISA